MNTVLHSITRTSTRALLLSSLGIGLASAVEPPVLSAFPRATQGASFSKALTSRKLTVRASNQNLGLRDLLQIPALDATVFSDSFEVATVTPQVVNPPPVFIVGGSAAERGFFNGLPNLIQLGRYDR